MEDRKWFSMMFYVIFAVASLVSAMVVFANYVVQIMDSAVRESMVTTDVLGFMCVMIVLLIVCVWNALHAGHEFLEWHERWKD